MTTPRRRTPQKNLRFPKFYLSTTGAVIAALILTIGHVTVELYKDLHPVLLAPQEMQVCFTPNKGCQQLILTQLNNAKKSIYIQAFSFTDPEIGASLIQAKSRGVAIKIILDHSNKTNKKSLKNTLIRHRIPLRIDAPSGIAHNKIIIIDDHLVITGSYNFSKGAYQRNVENVLILNDTILAKKYMENWQNRWDKSKT